MNFNKQKIFHQKVIQIIQIHLIRVKRINYKINHLKIIIVLNFQIYPMDHLKKIIKLLKDLNSLKKINFNHQNLNLKRINLQMKNQIYFLC